jgi:preprotein translocase subunit YajC
VGGFLILIVIFGAVWVLFMVPARRRRMSHAAMQNTLAAGDDVITAGGIHGTVHELVDDLVHVEIAPGVVVQVDRRAIAAVAREVEVEVDAESEAEPEAELEAELGLDGEQPPAPQALPEPEQPTRGTSGEPG